MTSEAPTPNPSPAAPHRGGASVPPPDLPTVVATGVLVYALALIAHGGARVLAGWIAGGAPSLVSSADTGGDWAGLGGDWAGLGGDWAGLGGDLAGLGEVATVAVGVSGSLANAALALVGWLVFRRGVGAPTTTTALGWLVFAVNAWIPTSYLVVSPLFAVGDWAAIVSVFPNQGPLRASLTVTGLFVAGLLWKETVPSLARAVGGGTASDRRERASRIVRTAWLGGGLVALLASLSSPLSGWAVPIALASTLGTTWPLLPAAGKVGEHPVPGAPLRLRRSPWLIVSGVLAGLLLVAVFGPGVRLGG